MEKKLLSQTGGVGGRKKKGTEEEEVGESSESNRSGREWLVKFSTMKVGPPRHVKVGIGVGKEKTLADGTQKGQPALKQKGSSRSIMSAQVLHYSHC